jgi:hypothetical protein
LPHGYRSPASGLRPFFSTIFLGPNRGVWSPVATTPFPKLQLINARSFPARGMRANMRLSPARFRMHGRRGKSRRNSELKIRTRQGQAAARRAVIADEPRQPGYPPEEVDSRPRAAIGPTSGVTLHTAPHVASAFALQATADKSLMRATVNATLREAAGVFFKDGPGLVAELLLPLGIEARGGRKIRLPACAGMSGKCF